MATINPPYIDLSGLYQVQKTFLNNYKESNFDLNLMNNALDNAKNNLDKSNVTNSYLYSEQNQMKDIVDSETNRLKLKQQEIDDSLTSKKRLLQLNDSARQRYNAYSFILMVLVFSLLIMLIVIIIQRNFPFIPIVVVYLINSIVILTTIILSINKIMEINSRDRLNYQELSIEGKYLLTPEEVQKQLQESQQKALKSDNANLLSTINLFECVGSNCCNEGTTWDEKSSSCIPKSTSTSGNKQGFTTLNLAYGSGELINHNTTLNGNAFLPNHSSEYDKYSKI